MNIDISQLTSAFKGVTYPYTDALDQQKANGLFWMAWGTAIGAFLGLLFQFSSRSSPSTAIFLIGDYALGATKISYLLLWFLSIANLVAVCLLLSRGKLNQASVIYVVTMFGVAVLGYVTTELTSFLLVTFTLPIISAGVLLTRRALMIVIAVTTATVVGLLLLYSAGALDRITVGRPTPEDVIIFGTIIFAIDGVILSVFAVGQRVLLQRNLALTRDLQLASERAQEASRLKSEFLATMSHELRTPLNAMLGFSGILLEGVKGEMDDEARRLVGRMEVNSKRLLTLINDILDITKIEAGRLELVMEPLDVRALAASWETQMSVLARQKDLDLIVEIDPDMPEQVYGDRERLTQIVMNLLSNAVKFTDRGQVKLVLQRQDDDWMIAVTDTGIGIPPHALNYIFDEFRQVDSTSTRAYGGTGLGLAITRNLCRMMGGQIRVQSTLGQGSTFTVTLPLHTAVAPAVVMETVS